MKAEERLRNRLKSSKNVGDVFESFAEYNGEKAEEARKKANMYLVGIFVIVIVIILSCLPC